jgi:plastocyanin
MTRDTVDAGARRTAGARPAPLARGAALIGLLGGLLALGCGGGSPAAAAARAVTHRIQIQGFVFEPADVAAAPGDTVVWTNLDFVPHTVTEDGGRWDSGSIGPNESWRLVVRAADTYHCTFHPNMQGRLSIR